MAPKLIVIGGGEHARVLIEAARSRPDLWDLEGLVDGDPAEETVRRMNVPRLGGDEAGIERAKDPQFAFILAMAGLKSAQARARLAASYDAAGARWAIVIHSDSWISPTASLEGGVFVSAGAVINTGARIEAHAIINSGSVIEHDVVVGAFAQVSPGATLGGAVRVGRGAYVGLGASVRDHVSIGEGATVGMGAVVVSSVQPNVLVMGNPARVQGTSSR